MDSTYGRNRQSISDIEDVLNGIFNGHPKSYINDDKQPCIPADALVDVLFSFSDAYNGDPLLSQEEQSMLEALLHANPGIEVTPVVLLQFIAQKTAGSPSPPLTPDDDNTMQLPDRGRSDDRHTMTHSRSSSNESNNAYHRGSNSSRPPSRGPPQTPTSGKSPFDAAARQRTTPLVPAPPSSWSGRPRPHRRKSDAGNQSDSESGHSGAPTSFRTAFGGGRRAPSAPASPASSSFDLGTFSPVSSPGPYSRPPSRQHSNNGSGNFASLHDFDASNDETVHGRRASLGGNEGLNSIPLPRFDPDTANDSDEEDSVLGLVMGRDYRDSTASMDDIERLHALQRQNEELKRKRIESEEILHKKLSEHEADYAELQALLDNVRQELNATKREEKELRSKERTSMQQIATMEAEIVKINKHFQSTKNTYTSLQKNYQEQCAASEKYRIELREREEELRATKESLSMTEVERDKLDKERAVYEDRIARLEVELNIAQAAFADLEEQKHENLLLKETIDRMRFDIDELRAASKSGLAGQSNSNEESGAGNTLQKELAGKMNFDDDADEGSEANTSTGSTAVEEEIDTEGEEEDVIQTIITRKKKKVASRAAIEKYQHREFEEVKEYSDTGIQYDPTYFAVSRSAQTDAPPKILYAAFSTQTDEPEPAPVAPKSTTTCEMEIQTDEPPAEPSRSPSPQNLESLASSSSTVVPATPKPAKAKALFDIDLSTITLDQPPSYSQVTDPEHQHNWNLVADVLRKWHAGAKIPLEPVAGGVSEDLVEEWKALKEELGVDCLVIDKIIESSGTKPPSKPSGSGKAKTHRNRFYNIYNTYVFGDNGKGTLMSTVVGQAVMVVSASALVMLAISPYVVPHYSIPGGATYYDRAAWNSFNSIGAAGEGFSVAARGDGTAAVWDLLGRVGGGAARMARGWPT